MSTPVFDSEWLEKQLPSSIAWGHAPLKISMKDAPKNVKAASIRLERVDSKDPPTVQHALPSAVVNKRDDGAALIVPKKPDGPIMVGTYRIAWSIVYTDGSKVQHGSKVYDGLASFYGVDEKKSLEKEAYKRLEDDDARAQAKERKGRY